MKRTIKILLTLIALLQPIGIMAQNVTNLHGDLNGDGKLDVADIATLINLIANSQGTTHHISAHYYLVGGPGEWGPSKDQMFSHSDIDVNDDPVFTYVMKSTGSSMWFAIGDDEALDAIATENDWSKLFGIKGNDGDLSGSFDYRYNLDGGTHAFYVDGSAPYYKISINARDFTYEITPLNTQYASFIYFIGTTEGWGNSDQKLASTGDGCYTGFCYVANQGLAFKFQREPGSWDNEINANSFTTKTGVTGDDNIEVAEEGVYYFEVNLAKSSISATKVNCMGIIGDFNSWAGDIVMTWNPDEYCYEVHDAPVNANGWKVRVNNDWALNLGGETLNNLVHNGQNLAAVGGTIKLYPTRKTSDTIYCTVE